MADILLYLKSLRVSPFLLKLILWWEFQNLKYIQLKPHNYCTFLGSQLNPLHFSLCLQLFLQSFKVRADLWRRPRGPVRQGTTQKSLVQLLSWGWPGYLLEYVKISLQKRLKVPTSFSFVYVVKHSNVSPLKETLLFTTLYKIKVICYYFIFIFCGPMSTRLIYTEPKRIFFVSM